MASALKEDYMQNQYPTKADRNFPTLVQNSPQGENSQCVQLSCLSSPRELESYSLKTERKGKNKRDSVSITCHKT